jgi:2-keto-4-pentenoate hydratase/2-oxohepta-3-ene-1,7-dioic acid hydratase in catechol pathway
MRTARFESASGEIVDAVWREDAWWSKEPESQLIDSDVWHQRAPVLPPAIFGIGLNYRRHAEETGKALPEKPMLFCKNPASVQHPGEPIRLPRLARSEKVDFEAELAVVIGKAARNVSEPEAFDFVAGFTCANDVSARDWQFEWGGGQFCRAKSFDTFCPLGPELVSPASANEGKALRITSRINGETMQDSTTDDLVFGIPALVAFLSQDTTLLPGTVILTGTPEGVGTARTPPRYLKPGDTVEIEIEGIGILHNPVIA